jgi:hypothetical protein
MSAERNLRVARVLSISGDGARTAIAAHVLAELERRTGQPLHKLFHLVVGEGAGALLALLVSLRSTGGRGLPLDAEAAAIAIEEGLPAIQPRASWWQRAQKGLFSSAPPRRRRPGVSHSASLTGADGLLGGADLSSALTDLAIPVFDIANVRPFLFRSWKAQGLYLRQGEGAGRYEFRGNEIAAAALRHPLSGIESASIRARSRAEFRLSGGGALAPDPVSLAALQARQLYRRANVVQTVSLSFGGQAQKGSVDWGQAGHRVLSQITAKGIAEQVVTLDLPAGQANSFVAPQALQRQMRLLAQAFLANEEHNGFSALVEEFSNTRPLPHTALRTPQTIQPSASVRDGGVLVAG